MQGTTSVKGEAETEAVPPAMQEEEERYVKAASRFFRVKQPRHDDGGSCSSDNNTPPRRLHYLESCFLCKKDIDCNRDVFMYKGDAAFCSDECRQDQMDMDEALHAVARRHRHLSSHSQSADAPVMRRRPTIANLAARSPPVPAS